MRGRKQKEKYKNTRHEKKTHLANFGSVPIAANWEGSREKLRLHVTTTAGTRPQEHRTRT
eukprot:6098062-Pyramimonas_sp.AAC.1